MQNFKLETPLPPFIPFPRFLLGLPLNETARLVYSLILSRIHLSQSNGWADGEGNVYCRYTIQDLMANTGKSKSTIVTALADLEAQGLLYRRRAGAGYANLLYLRLPDFNTSEDQKTVHQTAGKSAPNNKKNNKISIKTKKSIPDYSYRGDGF